MIFSRNTKNFIQTRLSCGAPLHKYNYFPEPSWCDIENSVHHDRNCGSEFQKSSSISVHKEVDWLFTSAAKRCWCLFNCVRSTCSPNVFCTQKSRQYIHVVFCFSSLRIHESISCKSGQYPVRNLHVFQANVQTLMYRIYIACIK